MWLDVYGSIIPQASQYSRFDLQNNYSANVRINKRINKDFLRILSKIRHHLFNLLQKGFCCVRVGPHTVAGGLVTKEA